MLGCFLKHLASSCTIPLKADHATILPDCCTRATAGQLLSRANCLGASGRDQNAMEPPKRTKERKTAEELEAMMLEDLSKMDDCP